MIIIQGGQTGVDRGAADAAAALGLMYGGAAPKGFKAEDGTIPEPYAEHMVETSFGYKERTRANVAEAEAVLIVYHRKLGGGSLLTYEFARSMKRPVLAVDPGPLGFEMGAGLVKGWWLALTTQLGLERLMVAGPRASKWPDGQTLARQLLIRALR